jgi:hypothetical protein
VGDVWQEEMHTAEPFEPEPSIHEVAIGKLKRCKSPGVNQIPAGGETWHSEIHKLIKLIWSKVELPHQWKNQLYLFTKRAIKLTSNYRGM